MRFGTPLIIPLLGGGRLKVARKPGERWRRRKSNAAQISDLLALHKPVLLCATCERRFPQKWGEHYGYRRLHDMHTEGQCDFQGPDCDGYAACNLYHFVEAGYYRQYEQGNAVIAAAKRQQIELRDHRRIRALD